MKIGFYIPNKKFSGVDCRFVDKGNPGIGGTWHVFLIVVSQLAKRDNGLEISVFVQEINNNLPEGPTYIICDSPECSVKEADLLNLDFLVLNISGFDWDHFDYSSITSNLKLIAWCHNFVPNHSALLDTFATQNRIARVINVGREQMDLYLDHKVFNKMDYIYNCVPMDPNNNIKPFANRGHIVTYVGSLMPIKSFHVLASIWPEVLSEIPDAELYVIGSGKLYNENAKLGRYNIAEDSYEKRFMPYLTDSHGDILPGVHFLGNMGFEKNAILAETKVGVPNPTGLTETFCISAVEMQSMGATVTAMSAPGYYDTIINGIIVKNKKQLTKSIIRLLKAKQSPIDNLKIKVVLHDKFSVDRVILDWELLFNQRCVRHIHQTIPLANKYYHLKFLKYAISKISCGFSLFKNIEYYFYQYERLRRHIRGY